MGGTRGKGAEYPEGETYMGNKVVKTGTSAIVQRADKKGLSGSGKSTTLKSNAAPKVTTVKKNGPEVKKAKVVATKKSKVPSKKKVTVAAKVLKKKISKKPEVKTTRGSKNPPRIGSRRKELTRACQDRFLEALTNNRFCIYKACKEAGISRQTFYHWRDTDNAFMARYDEVNEAKIDAWEEALHRNIIAGAEVSTIFGLKTKGRKRGYGDKPVPSREAVAIIKELLAEKITTKDAAYKLYMIGEQIPEVMKIELEKTPPDIPPPELPPAMDDAELEAGYRRKMAEIDKQEQEWVPKRRDEVQGIKDELKDIESFGPDAEMTKGDRGQES